MSKARCKYCGDILESINRHDFVSCSCFKDKNHDHGIFIDGGNDYIRCGGNFKDLVWINPDGSETPHTELMKENEQ